MKKPKPRTAKVDIDLNRWCIEMAMRWPIISSGGYGNAGAFQGGMPRQEIDADVIGRANRIMAWVKSPA